MKSLPLGMFFLALLLSGVGQGDRKRLVYVRHLEPPLRYPPLARQARLQGIIALKLTIAADGSVLTVEATTEDLLLKQHPLLQANTEELVKKWKFGCFECALTGPYEHNLTFIYRLEGEEKSYDDTRVVMELPDEVTVTASPRVCDHCPRPTQPKKRSRNLP